MAFGQQVGPPATARQLHELVTLLNAAGLADFRDARGPLGLTQRQAAGKFTRNEADALIAQLEASGTADDPAIASPAPAASPRPAAPARSRTPSGPTTDKPNPLRSVPSSHLAAELQRRGWVVMEP